MYISQNKIKHINLLKNKKYRIKYGNFVAEGLKIVDELIFSNTKIEYLIATVEWQEKNKFSNKDFEIYTISPKDLKKISSLKTPQEVIAVAKINRNTINNDEIKNKLSLVLSYIQDPGNLGTIIRLADWYGIENIFCSKNTVDLYNSKVIQASMGAIFRIKIHYLEIDKLLEDYSKLSNFNIYGTFLNGENIYTKQLTNNGFIVMGNEANGINKKLETYITERLHIPNFSVNPEKTESLNVAIATAIVCSEFKRLK